MKKMIKKLKALITEHIINNKKEYIIVILLFIIGIFLGVMFTNNIPDSQKTEIAEYIKNFENHIKEIDKLNYIELLKSNVKQNLLLSIMLWFFGTTVIGIPIVFGILMYKGFCFGYTISIFVSTLGFSKGIAFTITIFLVSSIFLIPAVIAIAVSGIKLYKSIIHDKRSENIKVEVLRHTLFSLIMLSLVLISAFIESFVSIRILKEICMIW